MDLTDLQKNRLLQKDPKQTDQTKDPTYTASNPNPYNPPIPGNDAPNVLTGTVITSCFIQTSALPSRVELQGNDITFYDDTTSKNGKVTGDTSRLVFTHNSGKEGAVITQGFIWEKRASEINSYDNVLSLYSLPTIQDPVAHIQTMNYMFFGLEGSGTEFNTNAIQFIVNHDTRPVTQDSGNGLWAVGGVTDSAKPGTPNLAVLHNSILGIPGEGYSVFIKPSGTGLIILDGAVNANEVDFPNGVTITTGSGSPEGVVTAPPGSLYLNDSGGAGTTVWAKESGTGNTGWTAVGSGGGSTPIVATLTGTPSSGATSMTFSPALAGLPGAGFYLVAFGSGEVRSIILNNGTTTCSWTYPLQTGATSNQVTIHTS